MDYSIVAVILLGLFILTIYLMKRDMQKFENSYKQHMANLLETEKALPKIFLKDSGIDIDKKIKTLRNKDISIDFKL